MSGFTFRQLGKTQLLVSPLGIGGGSGIGSEDLLYAFDRGVNYFFYSSDLHHFIYHNSTAALKTLCGAGSSVRDKVVLATASYVTNPEKIIAVILDQFKELGVDYVDIFQWGWVTEKDDVDGLIQVGNSLKAGGTLSRFIQEKVFQIENVNQELINRGLVRYVSASFHSRQLARQCLDKLDVVMLRYNLAHLGIENGIFPLLSADKSKDPGVVVFNVGHESGKLISTPPPGYPVEKYIPSIPDCYRYVLSNPWVDVVLSGVSNRSQLDAALAALDKGPLSREECDYFREYGALWRANGQNSSSPNPLLNFLGVGR